MIQTIRVKTSVGPDLLGQGVLHDIQTILHKKNVEKVETAKVYRLEGVTLSQAKLLAEKLFCESINQTYTINKPILGARGPVGSLPRPTSSSATLPAGARRGSPASATPRLTIEIAYKPGVMNPEVASIFKAASDLGVKLVACDSSHEYGFYGPSTLLRVEVVKIIKKLNLLNEIVEHVVDKTPSTLVITGTAGKTSTVPISKMSEEKLMELSKDTLFLNLEEMKVIQTYFQKEKRDPTDCELETLAQTWSEHSGHKTFRAKLIVDGKEKKPLIKRIKEEALKHNKHIVSAFVDNSGVMDFYEGYAINGKAETHNAPSSIEPYGGAMTGVGGVFRDILGTGTGAKPIASTDIFCFAPPDLDSSKLPSGTLPPLYLLKRVVAGVRDYGNRVGIPTNNGSVHFHEDFKARPTVLVGSYGILPKKYAQIGKPKKRELVVVVGGRTGRDGIHGATFSSGEMTDRTMNVNASAVQIGNAIEEKRVIDAILEARDKDIITAMQDVGGGGFSSAIGEIGKDVGVKIDLEKAPVKYPGLAPWEIWVSESQERMIVVLEKQNLKKLLAICKKYNVEASVLGEFDGSKRLHVSYRNEKVCDLSMEFLHEGLPQRVMHARRGPGGENRHSGKQSASRIRSWTSQDDKVKIPKSEKEWVEVFEKVLGHGNVCSKESILRLYDHTVQGTNALSLFSGVKMDGPNDAVVLRPLLNKPYGMVLSHGLNPILNNIDPYWGSIWAGVEALSNYVAVGGNFRESSLINNYVWPFPDEESLWAVDKSVDAVVEIMKTFGIPVISGKDSLSSTYRGKDGKVIKIPPVLCISVFGRIADVTKTVSSDFKSSQSLLVLVGKQDSAMGGSTYSDIGSSIPHADLKNLPKVFDALFNAIQKGLILSSHDVSEGGLATAVFEMCVGGNMGAVINAEKIGKENPDILLFNETAGTFIVEVADEESAEKAFQGVPYKIIGRTKPQEEISLFNGKELLVNISVDQLKTAWQKPMKEIFA